jgi:RDD family
LSTPAPQPQWKQEVNRRLEAHKIRKGMSLVDADASGESHHDVSDRAAQAAARVAARFSKAPSYGEMQAAEARAALRNAEVATRAALEAQAVAQAALDQFERAAAEEAESEAEASDREDSGESTMQLANPSEAASQAYAISPEPQDQTPAASAHADLSTAENSIRYVEPVQPIPANLIHFPREIVATRRLRPRIADAPQNRVDESSGQLSIFEVDPSSISIEPTLPLVETAAPAPPWSGPDWSTIELEPHVEDAKEVQPEPVVAASRIELAPLRLRIMAMVIDCALIVALLSAGIFGVSGHLPHAVAIKTAETGGCVALVAMAVLYYVFFLLSAMTTPGMMYARIALCTFDDEYPTRAQMRSRLGALLVSLLPIGLGFAWAIFDEDHLAWHDRLSRTYQRKC